MATYIKIIFLKRDLKNVFCNLKSSFLVLLSIVDANGQIYARMTNHGSESIRNVIFLLSKFISSEYFHKIHEYN